MSFFFICNLHPLADRELYYEGREFSRFLHRTISNARRLSLQIQLHDLFGKKKWLAPLLWGILVRSLTPQWRIQGKCWRCASPLGPISFFAMLFSTKLWPNNMLVSLLLGWGKSWIRHCSYFLPQSPIQCYTYIYVIPAAVQFTQHKLPHIPF